MSKKGNNQLIQNEDEKAIFNILLDAKQAELKCMIWKLVGTTKISAEAFIQVIRKFDGEIVFRAVSPGHNEKMKSIVSGADEANVYIMEKAVLFRSKVRKVEGNDLVLAFPKMLAQAERRKSLRLIVPYEVGCEVEFFKTTTTNGVQTQIFEKKCYDVSTGGLSFLLNRSETKFFEIGDSISNLKVKLDGLEFMTEGRIVNFIPVEPGPGNDVIYKGVRVCIKFEAIDEIAKDAVNSFVFKHLELDANAV